MSQEKESIHFIKKALYKTNRVTIKFQSKGSMKSNKFDSQNDNKKGLNDLIGTCLRNNFYKRNSIGSTIDSQRENQNSQLLMSMNIFSEGKHSKEITNKANLNKNELEITFCGKSQEKTKSVEKFNDSILNSRKSVRRIKSSNNTSEIFNKEPVSEFSVKKNFIPRQKIPFRREKFVTNEFTQNDTFSNQNEFSKTNGISKNDSKSHTQKDLPEIDKNPELFEKIYDKFNSNGDFGSKRTRKNSLFEQNERRSMKRLVSSSRLSYKDKSNRLEDLSRNASSNKIFSRTPFISQNPTRKPSFEVNDENLNDQLIANSNRDKISIKQKWILEGKYKETILKLKKETIKDKFRVLKFEVNKNNEKMKNIVENLKKCQVENEHIKKNFCKVDYLERKLKNKYFDQF